jgi:protein gp37
VFDNQVEGAWRADRFNLIEATPSLDWLLLTKRPQNIEKMLPKSWPEHGLSNVWLGTTAEDQARFDQRWPVLSRIPAAVRFISYEPAIGPLRLNPRHATQPDWLIAGGESGHGARPMNANWVRDVIDDCKSFGVAPFFKQWGAVSNNPLVAEQHVDRKAAAIAEAPRRIQDRVVLFLSKRMARSFDVRCQGQVDLRKMVGAAGFRGTRGNEFA